MVGRPSASGLGGPAHGGSRLKGPPSPTHRAIWVVFNPAAAHDTDTRIQFCVSGADAGDYYLHIEKGKCESFEGKAPAADLTFYTPDNVWVQIVHGQLDRAFLRH
jgi:hypothetical protein